MKSGMVTEPIDAVASRSRGATQRHAMTQKSVMIGTNNNHGSPYEYVCPEKPMKLLVLEYVAKN